MGVLGFIFISFSRFFLHASMYSTPHPSLVSLYCDDICLRDDICVCCCLISEVKSSLGHVGLHARRVRIHSPAEVLFYREV